MWEDDRFVGPFAVQLHTPRVGEHFLGMTKALVQIPGLSAINHEIATIVVGARHDAQYELTAHQALGRKFGLSDAEIRTLLDAKRPGTFDESQALFSTWHTNLPTTSTTTTTTTTMTVCLGIRRITNKMSVHSVQRVRAFTWNLSNSRVMSVHASVVFRSTRHSQRAV
jgi:hypothetical protein